MPDDSGADLKNAFAGDEKPSQAQAKTGEVPERIKKDAPAPELKPGGSWRARADAVDRAVREKQESNKAKNAWTARIKTERKESMSTGFKRSAKL